MSQALTLDEVLTFGKGMELETAGYFTANIGICLILCAVAILIGILLLIFKRGEGVLLIMFTVSVGVMYVGYSANSYPDEDVQQREVKELQWEREYAERYVRELPVVKIDDFQSFAYDYELEANPPIAERDKPAPRENEKPIRVKMADGKEVLFWAEIIHQADLEAPYLEYRYLDTPLRFDEDANVFMSEGFQNAKLYTKE